MSGIFEIFKDKKGEYRFRLYEDTFNEIIAVSEGYKSEDGVRKGIASVKKNAPNAPILGGAKPTTDPRDEYAEDEYFDVAAARKRLVPILEQALADLKRRQ